jgi:IclR family acetate operon transcriptional repressor
LQFADTAVAEAQLRTVCSPHAQRLAEVSGLTVLGGVLRGLEGVTFLKVASTKDNYPGALVGHHFDLHCTAMGKALITFASDTELNKIFREKAFTRYTRNTLGSLEILKVDLARLRARGYAINNEELAAGGRAVAAPILNHIGSVVASICVRGSADIFPEYRIPIYGKEVIATASAISRDLLEYLPNPVQV